MVAINNRAYSSSSFLVLAGECINIIFSLITTIICQNITCENMDHTWSQPTTVLSPAIKTTTFQRSMWVSGQPVAVHSKMSSLIDNPKYVDLDRLIEMIRENAVVWNSNLPEYHNRRVRKESSECHRWSAEFCMVNQGRHCTHLSVC